MLALCALFFVYNVADAADWFGLGAQPWMGYMDCNVAYLEQPYSFEISDVVRGGAAFRAGLRGGDREDLRDQSLVARVWTVEQPMAIQPFTMRIHRGAQTFDATLAASTWRDGNWGLKLGGDAVALVAAFWCLGCMLLIALRRAGSREAVVLALGLLSIGLGGINPEPEWGVPNPLAGLLLCAVPVALGLIALIALVWLSSCIGSDAPWRRFLSACAYTGAVALGSAFIAMNVGLVTLRFDPMPLNPFESYFSLAVIVELVIVIAAAASAVAAASASERTRVAWLLLPIPITLTAIQVAIAFGSTSTWVGSMSLWVVSLAFATLGALAVTYALLKRRVLDFEFVLSRALVVTTVSLIVISAFVLLEWLLGSVLAGVSHATGVAANTALALVLGVSLRYIHRRVDSAIDLVLFRKRHENERALIEFSQEAAYVTEADALLDQAIEKIQRHTDARRAAILLSGEGRFATVRAFGDLTAQEATENDSAVLALKTWHRPIDPNNFVTSLQGALAIPMLARGRLNGILLLGERAGGEAYAPDEIGALEQFAQGIGSALESLNSTAADSLATLRDALVASIASLQDSIASLRIHPRLAP